MNDFDKLKDLLFGAEKEALDSISNRVEQPETRTSDVADVLAEAIHKSHQENSDLVDSLTAPVGECLQQAFRDDPQTYGDALYPVIGPAIRKSISHTLREFSQQINQAVEHSLTPKGLKWRLQAARAGIPFGDFVMQKTLLYRVEQAYLISRENGLLIEHVHHAESKIKDSDAVSAMFTAIQDFVKESFSPDRTGRLESADMGEFTLWAVHGPHALLVCVIRGVPPKALRRELSAVLERIHFRYGDAVRNYAGDTESVPGVDLELEKCLGFQAQQDRDSGKSRTPWSLIVIAILAALAIGYVWADRWIADNQLHDLTLALGDTPGLYVAETSREGDTFIVRGMRDPIAPSVADVAAGVGISADLIESDMKPFQSLEPELIKARVEQVIGSSDSISYEITGSTAVVTGQASQGWIDETNERILAITGIDAVDFDGVVDSDLRQLTTDVDTLSGARFLFESGIVFAPGTEDELRQFAQRLLELNQRAAASGHIVRVAILGSTDNAGSAAVNTELASRRAQTVAAILSEFGITPDQLGRAISASTPQDPVSDLDQRHARIELSLIVQPGRL